MTITAKDVIPNAFLDDLGTDWVGVNAQGHIIARAPDQETVLKCGDPGEIVAAFNAEHLAHLIPPTTATSDTAPSEPIPAAPVDPANVVPVTETTPAPAKKTTKKSK